MLALLAILIAFITPFYIIYKPPTLLIRYFAFRWPDVLWHVYPTTEKVIALTIDDAPSEYTRSILEILKDNNATATFFVIGGQVHGAPQQEILKELVANGNELGNHAMHDEPSRSLPDSELISQIETVEGFIDGAYDAAGAPSHPARYFRPGSGFFSGRMRARVDMLGYRIVLGSVYPHDPQIPYPSINARHVLSMVRPGAIVICHDRRSWTIPMLRKVIPELKRRGYRITTVSGLLSQTAVN
ncbi:carbohydrate esterase family 4 protein [Aaosphaeria arxii CBS 175.79]|uniref:chitin deacetylase n=1 Tax=Aaosphaeria arxii CBS 175.79 TaxID=1450172 RepID=A0A6A5XZU7_9PLEO|nr:carbohydrate esterase family 4 protein [Aaosphaeria arxii CBS 175.79]KAF2018130.1 carbohydrate esterase family 4 protein [Aaosphaeria arxii CBS 175.79]